MTEMYGGGPTKPFGGRYQDHGLIFRDGTGGDGQRYVSGVAMAIGMFLVWASILGTLVIALLVALSWYVAEREWWTQPAGVPSLTVSLLVLSVVGAVGVIAATSGRHKLARGLTSSGLVRLVIGALALGAGLWWVVAANGIPL